MESIGARNWLTVACPTVPAGWRDLASARAAQADPGWRADYRATRPKVERKIGHLMRRKPGGRRARVRGQTKLAVDFALLAAAANLARFGVLDSPGTQTRVGRPPLRGHHAPVRAPGRF